MSRSSPAIRTRKSASRAPNDGYWSYLGTDILHIKRGEPTMNLESFTMSTPESEYKRVVRHETGHTLGFPHEHMRRQLVAEIDEAKAIAYFQRTQGWSADEVRFQVLTPLEDGSLIGTASADANSVMCYQIPGEITKTGEPIVGGTDIDRWDFDFISLIYPKLKTRPKVTKAKVAKKPAAKKTTARGKAKGKTATSRR